MWGIDFLLVQMNECRRLLYVYGKHSEPGRTMLMGPHGHLLISY